MAPLMTEIFHGPLMTEMLHGPPMTAMLHGWLSGSTANGRISLRHSWCWEPLIEVSWMIIQLLAAAQKHRTYGICVEGPT